MNGVEHIVICMRVGMCVCVYDCWGVAHPCLLCRSSKPLNPTAEEGQCITKHRRTWCYVETDSEKRNYKWNYLYELSLQSTIN